MSESYTIGGDTLFKLDDPNLAGQTFRPKEDHTLDFIDLELRGPLRLPKPVILVYEADDNHEPIDDYISRDRGIIESKSGLFTTGRVRFSMQPVLLKKGFPYVIVAGNYPPIGGTSAWWQYDKDDATYPRGIRISSSDKGLTWTKHYNDDHIFAEFGDPPLPKPFPSPPIDHFAPIGISFFHCVATTTITLSTSVPCHLTLYWTKETPRVHPTAAMIRGLPAMTDTYFCFVAWSTVDQNEPGDTLYHTFTITPWLLHETRWFTIKGNVDNILSPSVGPIFKHTPLIDGDFQNGGFENWPDPYKIAPFWNPVFSGPGSSAWIRTEIDPQAGIYAMRLLATGVGQHTQCRQDFCANYLSGKTVRWHLYIKGGHGGQRRAGMQIFGNPGMNFYRQAAPWGSYSHWTKTATLGPNCTAGVVLAESYCQTTSPTNVYVDSISFEIL